MEHQGRENFLSVRSDYDSPSFLTFNIPAIEEHHVFKLRRKLVYLKRCSGKVCCQTRVRRVDFLKETKGQVRIF